MKSVSSVIRYRSEFRFILYINYYFADFFILYVPLLVFSVSSHFCYFIIIFDWCASPYWYLMHTLLRLINPQRKLLILNLKILLTEYISLLLNNFYKLSPTFKNYIQPTESTLIQPECEFRSRDVRDSGFYQIWIREFQLALRQSWWTFSVSVSSLFRYLESQNIWHARTKN